MAYNQTNQQQLYNDHPSYDPKRHAGFCALSPNASEERAGVVKRKCTDVACLIMFLFALVPMNWILKHNVENADVRRLFHGYDFLGNLCGVDDPYADSAFVYYCVTNSNGTSLDMAHPMCVPTCPKSQNTTSWCFKEMTKASRQFQTDNHSFDQITKFSYAELPDYVTTPYEGKYCYPTDTTLAAQLEAEFESRSTLKYLEAASEIRGSWLVLLITLAASAALSFVYFQLIEHAASCMMYLAFGVLIATPFIGGTCFGISYTQNGMDGLPGTGDAFWDLGLSVFFFALFVVALILACLTKDAVHTSLEMLEASMHCIMDVKPLLLEPFLGLTWKLLVLLALLTTLIELLSCGKERGMSLQEYGNKYNGGEYDKGVSGMRRAFHYTEDQWYAIYYLVFMMFWLHELFSALSQFVLSYSVLVWYFSPFSKHDAHEKEGAPACPLIRGYFCAICYHLGSLAFGSFVLAVTRPFRIIFNLFCGRIKDQNNACCQCIARCCEGCMDCFDTSMAYLDKAAYMDMATTSNTFCTSSQRAFEILHDPEWMPTISILNGSCWIFEFAGAGMISSGATFFVFVIIRSVPMFYDPDSADFVAEPIALLLFVALLGLVAALCFMTVFETVSEMLLYCLAVESKRRARGIYSPEDVYAPEMLMHAYRETHTHHAYHLAEHAHGGGHH